MSLASTTSEVRLATIGWFTPTYVGLYHRATLSQHTGRPIMQEYNVFYHYWATDHDLTRAEVIRYLGAGYLNNMRH